jgi:hypothetical protein
VWCGQRSIRAAENDSDPEAKSVKDKAAQAGHCLTVWIE